MTGSTSADLSALIDDLADRLGDGGVADRGRARTVGAETEGAARGIAMANLDAAARYAEQVEDERREHRLMTLAMIVRAGEDSDVTGGIDADRGAFEQAAARARRGPWRARIPLLLTPQVDRFS